MSEVRQHASSNIVKILVGNKSDLKEQRQVSYEEGKQFAESLGMQFLETSAKEKINIDEAFTTLTKAILPTVPENKKQAGDSKCISIRWRHHYSSKKTSSQERRLLLIVNTVKLLLNLKSRGLGFGVWGLGFGVWGLGFDVTENMQRNDFRVLESKEKVH